MRRHRGFTLIELLVVVGVLGVLAAIAIPRFTSARNRAQDAVARADLRSAYTAALTARAAGGTWPDATALTATDAALRTTTGAASVGTVSVSATASTFRAATISASGACFQVVGDANGTPTWTQTTDNPCTAVVPLTLAYTDQSFTAGAADTLTPTVGGGLGSARTFTVTAGTLPAGVTLNATTGALTSTGLSGSSDGTLDPGFDSGGTSNIVYALAVQPDGKVLIGGDFMSAAGTTRNRLARVNSDGTLDTSFPNPAVGGTVRSIAIQPDGKILIGGTFSSVAGQTYGGVARLNTDGGLDPTFPNPNLSSGPGVYAIAVQPDGRILIGGQFSTVAGQSRNFFARLNADGSLDTGFNPNMPGGGAGGGGVVNAIAVQTDGKVVIGGDFTTIAATTRNRLARLNADGSLDTAFNPNVGAPGETVRVISLRPDGKVIIGGTFATVAGQARRSVARLDPSGILDSTFADPDVQSGGSIHTIAVQTDGKVVIGGDYGTVAGQNRSRLARLNTNGSLDTGFNPGANGTVFALALQPAGAILVGGNYWAIAGGNRSNVARLGGVTIPGFPATVTVQVSESGGGTASANLILTVV